MKIIFSKILLVSVCCLSFCPLLSCGYHLKGHGSSLPEYIEKIYVPVFKNDSIRYGLEVKLTDKVKREIINFGYKIVKDQSEADAELIGSVTRYHTAAENLDRSAKTKRIRINISVKVAFNDLVKKRSIYENLGYTSPSVAFDLPDNPDERNQLEELKIEEAVEELADRLIQEIFTGF